MRRVSDELENVRLALDALARSLEASRADGVLAAEAPLATAVGALVAADRTMADEDRARLALSVRAVRQAMARCVRLGAASGDLGRAVFPRAEYARGGHRPADSPFGPSLVSQG